MIVTPKRLRRRFADPNMWKKNVQKNNRLCGWSYTDRKGRIVSAGVLKTVDCKFRFQCRANVTVEQQKSFFNEYWGMKNPEHQKAYLCSLIIKENIYRKRKRCPDSNIDKTVSRKYHLPIENEDRVRVCSVFFLQYFWYFKKYSH